MATEVVSALRTFSSSWLQSSVSAAFGTAAKLIGTAAKATALGQVTLVSTGVAAYFVQIHNKATAPVNTDVPAWVGWVAIGGTVTMDFSTLGGLNCPLGCYIAISSTAGTLTLAMADAAVVSALYAQAP